MPASDGAIWIAADHEQAFIRVDVQSGAHTSFGYPNGGASVLTAAAGSEGSLWYIDGLNNGDVFRIERDGQFRRFPTTTDCIPSPLVSCRAVTARS
ncbi:MAG: hypothetical protein M3Z37_04100 [Candidatus Eremiobacteraeota bacterium]|nr:hypothetical protein [Candidatus Eremiobacteraeota bacterium]